VGAAWSLLLVMPLQERIQAWSNERVLYETSFCANPRSHVLCYNLGILHAQSGDLFSAAWFYE
jgi:hypothetical protein